jgi:glycosyltransferase involved in cell wall biosynthesis
MTIKVLHVCETAVGGVATYLNLLSALDDKVVQQHFLIPSAHCNALQDGLSVETFNSKTRSVIALRRMIQALWSKNRSYAPDIVFFHSTFALFGLLALRIVDRRTRAIYCAHGWAISRYDENSLKGMIVRLVEGRLCGLADVVVDVSYSDADQAKRLGYRGRHVVIENAAKDAALNARSDLFAVEPDELHLLFVGRFDRQKGLDVLLDSFILAHEHRHDLRLHIVGAAVRADGGAIELPDGASFSEWVDPTQIDDWYRSADALVVPSRWEGLPLVIPEALRNGTPVLCSTNSGMAGLISEGETGHAFALESATLSDLLSSLDRNQLRAMRSAARESFYKRFRVERFLSESAKLWRELAG